MGLDSIANDSVPAFSKDFGKKKRTNRLAKLKQCKLDARREQWLSQAKNKGSKEELNGDSGNSPSLSHLKNEESRQLENPETGSRGEENEGLSFQDSDLESLMNSSSTTDSRKDRPGSSCGSSSGSSTSGCCLGNFSEEEDDGCLDDWEAVADALTAADKRHHQNLESDASSELVIHMEPDAPDSRSESPSEASRVDVSKQESANMIVRAAPNSRAWRVDDAFRPQSLPNLSKKYSFTLNVEPHHLVHGTNAWARSSTTSQPSSCPICYEDLDLTDSSFLPCICGFRLCLFCYKRIFEVGDCRCPGCRRPYDPIDGTALVNGAAQPVVNGGTQAYRLSRSCSMNRRSLAKMPH